MSKNALTTYQFPTQMQWEYHQLMNSKESFLKNLSSAEQRKLEALYVELTNAWQRNHTETLNQALETKYQELREIQQIIKSDCADFRKSTEESLSANIQKKKQKLNTNMSSLAERKKNFEQSQLQRNLILSEKQQTLTQKRQTLAENQDFLNLESQRKSQALDEVEEKLNEKKQLLTETLELKNEELSKFIKIQTTYQADLQDLKQQLNASLQLLQTEKEQKLAEYKNLESNYQQDLKKIEQNLKADLSNYEEKLLQKLKQEILQEIQNCPEELKEYFLREEHSQISMKESLLSKETKERWNALTRGLSRIGLDKKGVDPAKFIELMEQHTLLNSN
ncbi:hypothetical protein EFA69_06105 [Rufibacter immobilis]|uniref:Uncharacterized protein n=1 Tax=Rufibacter immobilis TaxID=1348778 RepID=A0A3M9N1W1_9BACT|nr:hypothetical protein EFA69_06105 [Rufibacter immobilis]